MTDPVTMGSVGAFSSLVKIIQTLKDLTVSVEVKAKVTELYDIILAGQQSALEENIKQRQLLDTVRELEEKLAKLKAWDAEKQRYALKPLWDGGAVVYALKKSASNSEPPHWICAACYQNGAKGFLTEDRAEKRSSLVCSNPACRYQIRMSFRGEIQFKYAEDMKIAKEESLD